MLGLAASQAAETELPTLEALYYRWVAGFDFVWASPPCQAHSLATPAGRRDSHKCLILETRRLLEKARVRYVMENVPLAPLRRDLLLCGEMFGLRVIRHRIFEVSGFQVPQPRHLPHAGITNRTARKNGTLGTHRYEVVAGNGEARRGESVVKTWSDAMGIRHIKTIRGLAQSIPPAYSQYAAAFAAPGGVMPWMQTRLLNEKQGILF